MKTNLDFWRLHTSLTLYEAAHLMIGADPGETASLRESGLLAMNASLLALKRSLKLPGHPQGDLPVEELEVGEDFNVDPHRTTATFENLRAWVKARGFESAFFSTSDGPPYLDPTHPCYSPKLAAAVRAWEAIASDPDRPGRTVKARIANWLKAHTEEFQLVKADGTINKEAIEKQISLVVNWETKGGPAKTPG